eukprot:scaffold6821_cov66-Phaeocystis_antarctica.AAC.14
MFRAYPLLKTCCVQLARIQTTAASTRQHARSRGMPGPPVCDPRLVGAAAEPVPGAEPTGAASAAAAGPCVASGRCGGGRLACLIPTVHRADQRPGAQAS